MTLFSLFLFYKNKIPIHNKPYSTQKHYIDYCRYQILYREKIQEYFIKDVI